MSEPTTPEPMTDERLAEIRERCELATPGPWGVGNDTTIALNVEQESPGCFNYTVQLAEVAEDEDRRDDLWGQKNPPQVGAAEDDAQFIAHARQDAADLLAEVERLRIEAAERDGTIERLEGELESALSEESALAGDLARWREAAADPDLAVKHDRLLTALRKLIARCENGRRDNGDYYDKTGAQYEYGKAAIWGAMVGLLCDLLGEADKAGEAVELPLGSAE